MLQRLVILAGMSLTACAGTPPDAGVAESCAPSWQLVYRHDADGAALAGSKSRLMDAVRSGSPIRFAWGFRAERDGATISVEHTAEPVFLTIASGAEVVVQLPEHIGQTSYFDPSSASFETPAVMWRGLMSTDGTFDAVWVDRASGEQVRRMPQRVGLAWFALTRDEGCGATSPLELAVPGGVRRATE